MFVEDEWVKQLAVVSLRYRLISIEIDSYTCHSLKTIRWDADCPDVLSGSLSI